MTSTVDKVAVMQAYLDGKLIRMVDMTMAEWERDTYPHPIVTRAIVEANTKPEIQWRAGLPIEGPSQTDLYWDWVNIDYQVVPPQEFIDYIRRKL